jgi:hypothetical protein
MGFFNDPEGWLKSAGEDVSNVVSGVGNAVTDVLHSDLGKAAAIAAAVYFGAPYLGLTGEAASAAAAADAAAVGGTAEGAAALSTAAQTAQTSGSLANFASTLGTSVSELGSGAAAALGKAGSYLAANPGAMAAAGSVAGGLIGAYGANKAAGLSAESSANALALQKDIYNQQTALNDPYRTAGLTAQNKMLSVLGLGGDTSAPGYGQYAKDFSMADYTADPGYAFRLSEGLKQIRGAAAARGGAVSGSTMKGIQDYAQKSASQEYQSAFERYQTNRANQLQPLGGLMTAGLSAANQQSTAAGNYGANAAGTITNAGNVAAGAALGGATTIGNALSTGASAYANQSNFANWLAQNQKTAINPSAYTNPSYSSPSDPYAQFTQSGRA